MKNIFETFKNPPIDKEGSCAYERNLGLYFILNNIKTHNLYNYGYSIINELQNTDVDLYFIFTNENDKNMFKIKLSENIVLKFLLLSDFVNISIVEKTNSFVSIKKIYALSVLYEKYDYISCIDSEIKFINKNNFYEMMKNTVNNKIICGGKITNNMNLHKSIIRDSLIKLTDNKYHNELTNISQQFTIYTWWSNIPVYDCKIVNHFLMYINFNNKNIERFCWNIFDDMMYNYYCIILYNYKLIQIPNHNNSLEVSNTQLIEYVDKNICKLYWVNKNAYNQNKEYYNKSNFYIVYHLDR